MSIQNTTPTSAAAALLSEQVSRGQVCRHHHPSNNVLESFLSLAASASGTEAASNFRLAGKTSPVAAADVAR